MKAIIGRKVGMTQVFTTEGLGIPVTVVEVQPNVVLQKKTVEKDGYDALQVGIEDMRETLANKAEKGIFAKANTTPKQFVREIKGDELASYNVGDAVTVDVFQAGDLVDVTGTTKGKGFSGTVKRYGHAIGPKGHGSGYHRGAGSMATIGLTNNRIHPGKKMPGHHGNSTNTVLNLEVVAVDAEKNAILIKGAIPGPNKGVVTIRSAVKVSKSKPEVKTLVNYETAE